MLSVITLGALVQSCGTGGPRTGYQRVDGRWAWVSDAASFTQRVQPLHADDATFEPLAGGRFARDAASVFFDGDRLDGADAASFEVLGGVYSRDRHRAYVTVHAVPGADPGTFEPLAFPYARDARSVYYGTVRMDVALPEAFQVLEPSGGVAITPVRYLDDLHRGLGDTLRARGYAPDDRVVVGAAVGAGIGRGRAGDRDYLGGLPTD